MNLSQTFGVAWEGLTLNKGRSVLTALGVPFTAVHGSVRFSLSRYTTDEDVERIIEVFPEVVANLRRLSPYWDMEKNAPRPDAQELIQGSHAVPGA